MRYETMETLMFLFVVGCPSGFTYLTAAKRCFKVIHKPKTNQINVQKACSLLHANAHLAYIFSEAERKQIFSLIVAAYPSAGLCLHIVPFLEKDSKIHVTSILCQTNQHSENLVKQPLQNSLVFSNK
jgi:hypothetical protein